MNSKEIWDQVYNSNDLPWTENPIPSEILKNFISYFEPGQLVLDYGGGTGYLSKALMNSNLKVICADISMKALEKAKKNLPTLKVVQVDDPSHFIEEKVIFDGILSWGVIHHISRDKWEEHLASLKRILNPEGVILIGGHSIADSEFVDGYRISPTTGLKSNAINPIGNIAAKAELKVLEEGLFHFQEAFTGLPRVFKYLILQGLNE